MPFVPTDPVWRRHWSLVGAALATLSLAAAAQGREPECMYCAMFWCRPSMTFQPSASPHICSHADTSKKPVKADSDLSGGDDEDEDLNIDEDEEPSADDEVDLSTGDDEIRVSTGDDDDDN